MVCTAMLFAAGAAFAGAEGKIVLAERGKAAEYGIVLPEGASLAQRYAADELQKYVGRQTGVRLPVVAAGDAMPKKRIFIRTTDKWGEDGFRLVARPPHVEIEGDAKHGAIYGVYELLERFGGCEWFSSSTETVPELEAFSVPADLDAVQRPAFVCRDTCWFDAIRNLDFAAKMRLTGPHFRSEEKLGGQVVSFDSKFYSSHSFRHLMPPEEFFKEHPEYFCERNGFREQYQPCLSNPDVRRIAKERLLEHIAGWYPKIKYFTVSQNDNAYYCTCAKCKALDDREGTPAASILDFVNEMADAVKEKYPDVILHTLAYMYSVKAPKTIKARDNVMVVLCSDQCDHSRPMLGNRNRNNQQLVRELANWQRMAKWIEIWDYNANFVCYMIGHPNLKSMQPNLSFYRSRGVTHIYHEGAKEGPHMDLAEMRTWLLGKLLWNPDQPVEPLVERFCEGYFGAAAPYAKKYVDLMHSYSWDESVRPLHMWGNIPAELVPAAFYDAASAIWERAAEAVKDDPVRAANVRFASIPADWSRVVYSNYGGLLEVTRHPEYVNSRRFKELQAAARKVSAYFKEVPNSDKIGEVKTLAVQTRRRIDFLASLDPASVKAADSATAEETLAVVVEKKDGRVRRVDDPLARDGKAYRLEPAAGVCVNVQMNDVHTDAEGYYKVRARVRAELNAGVQGEAFFGAVCDSSKKYNVSPVAYVRHKADALKTDGYEWYDLADAWRPNAKQSVRLSIGDWDKNAANRNPAVKAIFVDAFEIVRVK